MRRSLSASSYGRHVTVDAPALGEHSAYRPTACRTSMKSCSRPKRPICATVSASAKLPSRATFCAPVEYKESVRVLVNAPSPPPPPPPPPRYPSRDLLCVRQAPLRQASFSRVVLPIRQHSPPRARVLHIRQASSSRARQFPSRDVLRVH
ncbi:hypothetical protein PYCCODRAFT_87233 [Trametes coccinea BRFM310]|uniref:Uncharacterized protein n=1 Tax=Trametes coccinea (strain BRFM310) TaxID=1353009 RepID=A0A1Y2I5H7_TRAC3|nr:hypothetical protein PYCCODRAFT_87233 [Trametes coccinea BRFM310]